MSINDTKYAAVNTTNLSLGDEYYSWLGANGGVGDTVMDREYSMLVSLGGVPGTVDDMWNQVLLSLGFGPGSMQDMLYAFWAAGGVLGLRMNDGGISADGLLVTVNFSRNVFFTELTIPNGMVITNITTGETATISAQIGTGTSQAAYTTSWPKPPLFGDTFKIEYDGLGDYVDEDSEPLKAQILNLQNQTINFTILAGWTGLQYCGLTAVTTDAGEFLTTDSGVFITI